MSYQEYRAFPLDEQGQVKVEKHGKQVTVPSVSLSWDSRTQPQPEWLKGRPGWKIVEYKRFEPPPFLIELRRRYPEAAVVVQPAKSLDWPG